MSKQITNEELAELTLGLLLNPELLGELETSDQYKSFMHDIAEVIADHCGGVINCVHEPLPGNPDGDNALYLVSVSPSDSLPSFNQNVWSAFDPEGWEEEDAASYGIEVGETTDTKQLRTQLRSCLIPSEQNPLSFRCHQMRDWRVADNIQFEEQADSVPWTVNCHIGNQVNLEFLDTDNEAYYGVLSGIHLGVPALKITQYGNCLLHIQMTNDGLVLVPESNDSQLTQARLDRHSFHQGHAYLLKA
ncbi:hypothetical protein [Enterovibrio norvegicus]|uniref:hypothetical protein n=1 Tax=Enterovibrio norvegicus TaxID=188144 RepID=UPI00352D200B